MGLAIQLPARSNQTEFNLARWEEVLADPGLARLEQRVETDRHGHVIMSPPPGSRHSDLQSEIAFKLRELLPEGVTRVEVPVSTADGVRAADVAWTRSERIEAIRDRRAYREAPDICVEVLSPSNTNEEIEEKVALYFDAGATEVWICNEDGVMDFRVRPDRMAERSALCHDFPLHIAIG